MFDRMVRSFKKFADKSRGQTARPRLEVESLEDRWVPSAASIHAFVPIQQLVADVRIDTADIQADVQKLTNALASNTNATVAADLNALKADAALVFTDIESGVSATADINAAITAEARLQTDLGSGATRAVRHQLNDLGNDLRDLRNDLNQIGKDLRKDKAEIQADAAALTSKLGSITLSATVLADANTVNTDLAKLYADLAAGNGSAASADLNATIAAEATLKTDLGASATPAIRHALTDLNHGLRDLTQDIALLSRIANRNVADIQRDASKLSAALASNANATVVADVAALNAKLAIVVNESAAGAISAADLKALIDAEAKLTADLGTNVSPNIARMLRDLRNDLLALQLERLAFFA